jgi:hypothetical protein
MHARSPQQASGHRKQLGIQPQCQSFRASETYPTTSDYIARETTTLHSTAIGV